MNNEMNDRYISNKWIFEKEDLVIESRIIGGEEIRIFINEQPTKRVIFEGTSNVCSFVYKNDRFIITPPNVLSKDSQRRLFRNGIDCLNGDQFDFNQKNYIIKVVAASALMIPLFPLIIVKAIQQNQDKVIVIQKDFSKSNNDNILYQQSKFVFVEKKFNFLAVDYNDNNNNNNNSFLSINNI